MQTAVFPELEPCPDGRTIPLKGYHSQTGVLLPPAYGNLCISGYHNQTGNPWFYQKGILSILRLPDQEEFSDISALPQEVSFLVT